MLDEATSQLDSMTAHSIQSNITNIIADKTYIIVTHRLSTSMNVDRYHACFDDGQIVEISTLDELLKKKSLFYTLWNAQVNGFLLSKKKQKP